MTRVGVADFPELGEAAYELELMGHVVTVINRFQVAESLPSSIEALVIPARMLRDTPDLVRRCDASGIRLIAVSAATDGDLGEMAVGVPCIRPHEFSDQFPRAVAGARVVRPERTRGRGQVVTLWGAAGAPGVSLLAANLAVEAADLSGSVTRRARRPREQRRVALVDLDCWAPSLAAMFATGSDIPGVAAAARLVEFGGWSETEFERLSVLTAHGVRLLTGLTALHRWPELTASRVAGIVEGLRSWADLVVIDAGCHASSDDGVARDPLAPDRSAAAQAAFAAADVRIGVGAADPIGLARLIRSWSSWCPDNDPNTHLVVNKVRRRAPGMESAAQVRRVCVDFLGRTPLALLPLEHRAADAALTAAAPLATAAAKSTLRAGIRDLALKLVTERDASRSTPPATAA